jgi:hypothetical protein
VSTLPPPAPGPRPCSSCPYRRDVPAGVWHPDEYAKLPPYDAGTGDQPIGLFYCHQTDGRLCAGWCGTHDMDNALAVRFGAYTGILDPDTLHAIGEYRTDVPLFASGQEAADHGMSGVAEPGDKARRTIARLVKKGVAQ